MEYNKKTELIHVHKIKRSGWETGVHETNMVNLWTRPKVYIEQYIL